MKTPEELNSLKEEVEALNGKIAALTEDELEQIIGGSYRKNGKTYSSDPPHYLITTAFNKCSSYKRAYDCKDDWFDRCSNCYFRKRSGVVLYCEHFTDHGE